VHHYHYAGDVEKERHYARLAGEQAAAQFANSEAVTYLSRALELTPVEASAGRYAILLARERVYDVLGLYEAQLQDLAALQGLAAGGGDGAIYWPAEVALRRSQYAEATGDYPASIAAAQEAIDRAQAAGGSEAVRLEAAGHMRWGWTLWRQGEYEAAQEHLEHALELAQGAQLLSIEADCHRSLGNVFLYQSMHDRTRFHLERALEIYSQVGERRRHAVVLNDMGNFAMDIGDYGAARSYYEQSLAIKREIGDRRGEANGMNNLGLIAMDQGDCAAAFRYLEQSLQIRREVGDRRGEGSALGGLGNVALAQGDLDRAREYLEQGLLVQREIGDRYNQCVSLDLLGVTCHHVGDEAAAQSYGQQALLIAQEMGDRSSQAFALTHIGNAQAGLGQTAEAAAAYEQALTIRRELGQQKMALEVLSCQVRLDLERGDLTSAREKVESVLALMRRDAPPTAPEVVVQCLDGTDDPFLILLTCCRVLRASGDARAPAVLAATRGLLLERVARVGDECARRSFLEKIPSHREIVEMG
jgi:tetratricopeptide (TPR) repeat protein